MAGVVGTVLCGRFLWRTLRTDLRYCGDTKTRAHCVQAIGTTATETRTHGRHGSTRRDRPGRSDVLLAGARRRDGGVSAVRVPFRTGPPPPSPRAHSRYLPTRGARPGSRMSDSRVHIRSTVRINLHDNRIIRKRGLFRIIIIRCYIIVIIVRGTRSLRNARRPADLSF